MEGLKEASIQVERIRGAIWFCDELITKLEGNGLAVEAEDAKAE